MRTQLKLLGYAYDWNRESWPPVEPDYYRWEQWFFNQAVSKKGLAYKKNGGGELGPGGADRAGQ